MWVAPSLTSGLGNRLFQLAAAAGAAEHWGRELVFSMEYCKESPHGPIASIFRMFPFIRVITTSESSIEIKEPGSRFYEYIPLWPIPGKNCVVCGFRQSPKYFPTRFEPDWDSALGGPLVRKKLEILSGLSTMKERQRTYAVHVRLGGYKYLAHHQLDLTRYYKEALERIPAGSRLKIFSDEPNLCRGIFSGLKDIEITVAATASDTESLYEMSLCLGGTITANSTFSWWGAWFAHQAGASWAMYPSLMGNGQPEPIDLVPEWGIVITV